MKKPWLAAILNIILTGLGYIYNGKRMSFGILMVISTLLIYGSSSEGEKLFQVFSIETIIIAVASWIIMVIAFAYDAYKDAQEVNQK